MPRQQLLEIVDVFDRLHFLPPCNPETGARLAPQHILTSLWLCATKLSVASRYRIGYFFATSAGPRCNKLETPPLSSVVDNIFPPMLYVCPMSRLAII
jgi:hypothetical protein